MDKINKVQNPIISKGVLQMIYSQEVENMCPVAQGVNHGAASIPEEAKWVKSKEVKDISGLTHGALAMCAAAGCL